MSRKIIITEKQLDFLRKNPYCRSMTGLMYNRSTLSEHVGSDIAVYTYENISKDRIIDVQKIKQ